MKTTSLHRICGTGLATLALPVMAQVERAWLTHRTNVPSRIVVNWETKAPCESVLEYGTTARLGDRAVVDEAVTLHHVEVPFPAEGHFHYRIPCGNHPAFVGRVKSYGGEVLRVAVAADWQRKAKLEGMLADDVHLLVTCGDHVPHVMDRAQPGNKTNTKTFSQLISRYQDLFRSVPVMPALGNHDRQLRSRGKRYPPQPTYDVDATAFLSFFPLPDDGWKWFFDVPGLDVRFVALDFNHTSDFGTTWQSCHPFDANSEQFKWYEKLMSRTDRRFVITLYNEINRAMRARAGGIWRPLFEKGTMAITGYGYFAERAEIDGFPYYNTALGVGDKYPDPGSKFLAMKPSYMLLTLRKGSPTVSVEIKDLAGTVLDKTTWPARKAGGN